MDIDEITLYDIQNGNPIVQQLQQEVPSLYLFVMAADEFRPFDASNFENLNVYYVIVEED